MEIKFLNVDLAIESSEDLQPIIADFSEDVSVMYNGEWENGFNLASFEIKYSFEKSADEIISEFCILIENFSSESKLIWEKCHSKKFDIGFESGSVGRLETEIRAETVGRVSKLGASILVTIYPNGE